MSTANKHNSEPKCSEERIITMATNESTLSEDRLITMATNKPTFNENSLVTKANNKPTLSEHNVSPNPCSFQVLVGHPPCCPCPQQEIELRHNNCYYMLRMFVALAVLTIFISISYNK